MSNEDGTIWLAYNGEIYNYRQLRDELETKGHRFCSSGDTEVLLHLYEERGTGALPLLRGMFAFALWDSRARRLLLGRDRFGQKPLYYVMSPSGFYFASEMRALLRAAIPREIDQEAISLYLQFLYVPEPLTGIRAIRKVPWGSWITYDANTGDLHEERYWRLPVPIEQPTPGQNEDETCARLRDKFDEAVRIRMQADVPVGAFLSGGLDSSSVVASMARQSAAPVKTFSAGFEEPEFDETRYAAAVAAKYRSDHHELIVGAASVHLLPKLVRHFGEPFADTSAVPTFLIAQLAARHVRVVLSGDGGDEMFAGYEVFAEVQRMRALDCIPPPLRRVLAAVAGAMPYGCYGKNYLHMVSRISPLERYFEHTCIPYFLRKNAVRDEYMLPAEDAYYRRALAEFLAPGKADLLTHALYFAATSTLVANMLVKVDRMSMAHGLEVRSPYLDHELAEMAMSIPHGWKLRGGRGKDIIYRAWGNRFPHELLNRPKMGFTPPVSKWLRTSMREFLRDNLTSPRFFNRGVVSAAFLQRMVREHDSLRRDHSRWLWALLMLELWFEEMEEADQRCFAASS